MNSFGVPIFQSLATDFADKGAMDHDLPLAIPRLPVQEERGLRAIGAPALTAAERLHCEKKVIYDSDQFHSSIAKKPPR